RPDLRLRQQLGEQLTALVRKEPEITHDLAAQLLDALVSWLNGGNFKVCSSILENLARRAALAERMGPEFSHYVPTVLPHIIDRAAPPRALLGRLMPALTHKAPHTREEALKCIQSLLDTAAPPRALLGRLMPALTHKAPHTREEALKCIQHGAQELQLRAAIPNLAALVGDPSSAVRDAAVLLLIDVYRH
ncbi:CLIP-associating protein, partial [Operophtera brumata]